MKDFDLSIHKFGVLGVCNRLKINSNKEGERFLNSLIDYYTRFEGLTDGQFKALRGMFYRIQYECKESLFDAR